MRFLLHLDIRHVVGKRITRGIKLRERGRHREVEKAREIGAGGVAMLKGSHHLHWTLGKSSHGANDHLFWSSQN